MSDRFKFRATFSISYYDENGNDKDIKLTIYDVAVCSGGEIGFSAQQIETIINALELPEIEEDTMWQFINDNYATSCYEWFVCDNAIIEQCTGLKDTNEKLIYENDIVEQSPSGNKYKIIWVDSDCGWGLENTQTRYIRTMDCFDGDELEIIGNIHETKGGKDE